MQHLLKKIPENAVRMNHCPLLMKIVNCDCNNTKICQWLGVQHLQDKVTGEFEPFFIREYRNTKFLLQDGFTSKSSVLTTNGHTIVTCELKAAGSRPLFICSSGENKFSSNNISNVVEQTLGGIGYCGKKTLVCI